MSKIHIVSYKAQFREAFYRLNAEWLEKYFYIEDYDREVLSKPKQYILDKGGHILFALDDGEVVGTVALIDRGEDGYEISKMAVRPVNQGRRIGLKMMYAAIYRAIELGADRVFLDSNTKLEPAIRLYQKVGFREIPVPKNTPYERCNIRMELWV